MRKGWSIVNSQWSILLQRVLLIAGLLVFWNDSVSQKISTILSKDKIVLGEQVTLKIQVEGITSKDVQQDFVFPDTVNHIEILTDSIDGDGPDFIHTLTLTSFDSGYWQFPSYEILLSGNRNLVSQAVDITVLPVDISNMADYHDIKDILDPQSENNWWIIASIVALALLSLFAFLWFITNKVQHQPITETTDLEKLYNAFLKKIHVLENTDVSERTVLTNMFKELTQATRHFIDAAYQKNTTHQTTGEYILQYKGKLPDVETENNYFQFLRLADAVKFAKYIPPGDESRSVFPMLKKLIEQVYQTKKQAG